MDGNQDEITRPLVSICIPTYKYLNLFKQCIQSLAVQTFTNFEVIVTDDSPNDDIGNYIKDSAFPFSILYHKNSPALGSPSNWNAAIKLAKGKYIKIMHHDGWFSSPNSLAKFCSALEQSPNVLFAFAQSRDYIHDVKQPLRCNFKDELQKWQESKNYVINNNFLGDPSTIIFRNNNNLFYDERMKWCVDTDFNMTLYAQNKNIILIPEDLVYMSAHDGQITNTVQNDPAVVLYENILLLNKHDVKKLTLHQFDFYWRMLRRFNIRSTQQLLHYSKEQIPPTYLLNMVKLQKKILPQFLQNGVVSKFFMGWCFSFS
jgi:glycosyltransferase involved in cell wall biosynthesis